MPSFHYKGVSEAGRNVAGTIEAENPRAARAALRDQGVFASEMRELAEQTKSAFALPGFSGRVGAHELSRTTRQLATLLRAGVPLADAVGSLHRQSASTTMKNALQAVRSQLLEGQSFAAALAKQPNAFPAIYTGMVAAGEASGALDVVLLRVADHAEGNARLQQRARTALTYPTIMTLVGGGIVLFLLSYVVPQVTRVFANAHQQLPLPTRALMALGAFLGNWGLLLLLLAAAAGLGLRYLVRLEAGRRRFERMLFALPVLGRLARDIAVARFAQTLATMVAGGLPLLQALRIARSASGSLLVAEALERTETAVSEGASLAGHLEGDPLFPPMIVDMISVGERSGDLEGMLGKASEALEDEVRDRIETMAALLEPAMILLMAGVVLFVILAILLPVFEMNQLVR